MESAAPSITPRPGGGCAAGEISLGRAMRALRLGNETLDVTLLPDKGADIYELVYRPQGIDVLWKSPWGLRQPGHGPSAAAAAPEAFLDAYGGGWQVLFPNGGDACEYQGATLPFHGEATMATWDYVIADPGPSAAEIRLSTRLRRSPFRLERRLRVASGHPVLTLTERIVNEGREPLAYMWSHHPAFGAPFLSAACRIDIPARTLQADDRAPGATGTLTPDRRYAWPVVIQGSPPSQPVDLAQVPGQDGRRALLAYFQDFTAGWYAITNKELGFGVGLTWPVDVFPYAWFWQEMHGTPGYPWYQGVYVMAIEPASSIPGQGLQAVMAKTGTHRILEPGAAVQAELRVVFYESRNGVANIEADGTVRTR